MICNSIFDWVGLGLLRIAVVRSKPDFGWVIQTNFLGHSLHNVIICMQL
jgi:hypothetical protein